MDEGIEDLVQTIARYAREGRAWPTGRLVSELQDYEIKAASYQEDENDQVPTGDDDLSEDWREPTHSDQSLPVEVLKELILGAQDRDDNVQELSLVIDNVEVIGELDVDGARIERPVRFYNSILSDGFSITNSRLFQLSFQGCRLKRLSLRGTELEKNFALEHSIVIGTVDLRRSSTGGSVSLAGSSLSPESDRDAYALDIRNAKISSDVLLQHGFRAVGMIDCSNAKIGGSFLLSGAKLEERHANNRIFALLGSNISVDGSVRMDRGFSAEGAVDFSQAVVGAQFVVVCASLNAHTQVHHWPASALNLKNARISQDLTIRTLNELSGAINLEGVSTRTFIDDPTEWLQKRSLGRGLLWLNGFEYRSIVVSTPRDSSLRRAWLRYVLPRHYLKPVFIRQPWAQLAAVFRTRGDYDTADTLLAEAEALRLKRSIERSLRTVSGWIALPFSGLFYAYMRFTKFGLGYAYLRTLYVLLIMWAIGVLIFSDAAGNGRMKPVEEEVLIFLEEQNGDVIPEWYTNYNSFYYAADVLIPINLGQQNKWAPMTAKERSLHIRHNDPADMPALTYFRKAFLDFIPIRGQWSEMSLTRTWYGFSLVAGWLSFIVIGASFAGGFRRGGRSKE